MSQLGIEMAPEQRSKRSRIGALIAVLLSLLVVAALLAGLLVVGLKLIKTTGSDDYPGPGSGQVDVRVVSGETSQAIGTTLAANGVIRSASVFASLGDERLRQIQPGTYRMRKQMSAAGALDLLLDPAARVSVRAVIPEGATVKKTLALLAAKGKLDPQDLAAAAADPSALGLPAYAKGQLEGFLFPATYDIDPSMSSEQQLKAMVTRWRQAARDEDLTATAKKLKLDPYQVMIIASLLQAEAQPKDFAKVARVISNRLDAGMRLQLDTTVLYALGRSGTKLTPDDLKTNSPFNTYLHKGLPPSPIDNPGQAAIHAALHPAKGDWLYYVTVDLKTGETKFTNSYKEFLQFKQELKANSSS
jgi:UPF0755 protein